MPVAKVNQLFKTLGALDPQLSALAEVTPSLPILGCKVEKLTRKELDRRRLPESEANTKWAHLTVPLEFPKARIKRRN
jgi:DNA-directed RNA polymerase I subunit RPA49